MEKYSFGAFLTVLSLCSPKSTTNKYLCGTMFLAVDPSYDISEDDGTVGHLKNCMNNVSPSIMDNISRVDAYKISECFEKKIIPYLSPDMHTFIVATLIHIFLKDNRFDEDYSMGVINNLSKSNYRVETDYVFSDLLTDFFIFSLSGITNKAGKDFISEVTLDYIKAQAVFAGNIKLTSNRAMIIPSLPKTLNGKNFYSVFTKVTEAKIGIKGNEELKIFKLNVEDNEFTYEGLRKLLNANIGRYVFSRLTMEQYKNNDDLESVGGDAAQYIREHVSGNELGEMLIYAFLEEILNAPKLMSAIELGSADNRSAGIHLYNLPGQKNNFQLVYGASNIKGDIKLQ